MAFLLYFWRICFNPLFWGQIKWGGGYTGSCTNLCTVDRVKKPVYGVRILQDKFPTSLLDSVWNLCNWQSKVSKVGFRPLVMNHFPTKSATLKFWTRMAGSGTESPNIRLLSICKQLKRKNRTHNDTKLKHGEKWGGGLTLNRRWSFSWQQGKKWMQSAKIGEKRARGRYTGSCTNLCTVDRVKKPVSGVRILQDKFPTSLLDSVWNLCKMADKFPTSLVDSVWNLCNWQSKVSKVGFRPLVMNHFPTKSATLKSLTRMAGSGTEFQHQASELMLLVSIRLIHIFSTVSASISRERTELTWHPVSSGRLIACMEASNVSSTRWVCNALCQFQPGNNKAGK
ncbi:hypothetical protein NC651_039698 [Populus alba x Populus x berolinensis]|nr:hypothetical protein NC651_039698 [Populus alba x Populus x berolinensis]